jgi:hypothetical protein
MIALVLPLKGKITTRERWLRPIAPHSSDQSTFCFYPPAYPTQILQSSRKEISPNHITLEHIMLLRKGNSQENTQEIVNSKKLTSQERAVFCNFSSTATFTVHYSYPQCKRLK